MEIKTLAQIIAENADCTEKSSKSKRSDNRTNSKNAKAVKGFGKRTDGQNSRHTKSKNPPRQHPNADRAFFDSDIGDSDIFANDLADTDLINKEAVDTQFVESDVISHTDAKGVHSTDHTGTLDNRRSKRKRSKSKPFHPASSYQAKTASLPPVKEVNPNSIKSLLAQVKAEGHQSNKATAQLPTDGDQLQTDRSDSDSANGLDNLPEALKAYLRTPEQRQAEKEAIKANSRLRWLAFYYLSRREHSAGELRQKLIDKEQDPAKIDELLAEFADKGYQSDYRTALMLIREGIRKRRGRARIKNDFYQRKVAMPANIDELIDMAMADNEAFADVMSDNDLVDGVDWLRLAVEARVKKYGDEVPVDPKAKSRQLRFLQYRGFRPDICFQAIGYNLDTLDNRF